MRISFFIIGIIFLFVGYNLNAQVSVIESIHEVNEELGESVFERFKKTTTLFVLPSVYDKGSYEKLLEETWSVTPYKIIHTDSFDLKEYLTDKYSIATIDMDLYYRELEYERLLPNLDIKPYTVSHHKVYLGIKIYDNRRFWERFAKVPVKKQEERLEYISDGYRLYLSKIYLTPKDTLMGLFFKRVQFPGKTKNMTHASMHDDVFWEYKLGFLKNYLQKVNSLLEEKKTYNPHEDINSPKLGRLYTDTLMIPEYVISKFTYLFKVCEDTPRGNNFFSSYPYPYKIIKDVKLNEDILRGKGFYYVRYTRKNYTKVLEIINSETGDILYRKIVRGRKLNFNEKSIKDLVNKVKGYAKK